MMELWPCSRAPLNDCELGRPGRVLMDTFFWPAGLQRCLELVSRQAYSSPVEKFHGGDSSRMGQ
jgi:hypothetical protein